MILVLRYASVFALNDEGIPVFKMFIWGSISPGIWSEVSFYGDAQMNILNMGIPILMHFWTFIRQRHSILHQTETS